MRFENTEVFNFEGALRGMRNPMNSWDKADSEYQYSYDEGGWCSKDYVIGENDLKLARQLIKAGAEHRKFLRQIFISVDITAPMYFFSELDTYKVGTVANSTSKMHKLASTPITRDCFEMGDFADINVSTVMFDKKISLMTSSFYDLIIIPYLERLRQKYNETKDKRYWKELIRLLPESWLQKRTITMNYENLYSMMKQRKNHKLTEWSKDFMDWAENLPYVKELIIDNE